MSGGFSPDGSRYALIRSINGEGNPNLYVASPGSQPVRLTGDSDIEASPCWSPDGRRIAYVSGPVNRPSLRVISSAGGTPTRIRLAGTQNVAPDWGPDGRIAIASLLYGSFQITVVDPDTGQSAVVTDGGANYEDPTWAPDGRHVLCSQASRDGRSSLVLVDTMVAEGQAKPKPFRLTLPEGDWYSPSWSR